MIHTNCFNWNSVYSVFLLGEENVGQMAPTTLRINMAFLSVMTKSFYWLRTTEMLGGLYGFTSW